jgi:hypothetical protein
MWREENGTKLKPPTDAASEMRSAGITPGGMAGEMAGQEGEATDDMAAAAEAGAAPGAEAAPAEPPAQ